MSRKNEPKVEIKGYIDRLLPFIHQYKWLIDSYISDYFVEELWKKVPSEWWYVLSSLEPTELASLLHPDTWNTHVVWPLSLLAFRSVVTKLCLQRAPVDVNTLRWSPGGPCVCDSKLGEDTDTITDGQYLKLEHCYRRHVKPKKQHEILQLGQVVRGLCEQCTCNRVVDVGAGLGHLARLMTFGHGIKVTTIEAAGCHRPKAQKFDREVSSDISKGRVSTDESLQHGVPEPDHVTAMIDPSIPVEQFLHTLKLTAHCSPPVQHGGSQSHHQAGRSGHEHVSELHQGCSKQCKCGSIQHCCKLDDDQIIGSLDAGQRTSSDCDSKMNLHDCDKDYKSQGTKPNYVPSEAPSDGDSQGANAEEVSSKAPSIINSQRAEAGEVTSEAPGDVLVDSQGTEEGKVTDNATSDVDSEGAETTEVSCKAPGAVNSGIFVLTGLHPCGDLTPTMLRVFVQCPQAEALAVVSCCYMKLSSHRGVNDPEQLVGYPMSDYVRSLAGHDMSYEALEMACHFVDSYHDRLKENRPELRSHVYRAALQEVIKEKAPHIHHGCIKLTVKHAHTLPFSQYASAALGRLKVEGTLTNDQLSRAGRRLESWRYVVAFYTLRLSLAPLVETVILLDRLLYLLEQGIPCRLLPIFDPRLSPRNFVLLAKKDEHSGQI